MIFMGLQLWGGLPLVAFIGLMVAARYGGASWLAAGLQTIPVWASIVWVLTNGLSCADALNAEALKIAWGGIATMAVLYAIRRYRSALAQPDPLPLQALDPFE